MFPPHGQRNGNLAFARNLHGRNFTGHRRKPQVRHTGPPLLKTTSATNFPGAGKLFRFGARLRLGREKVFTHPNTRTDCDTAGAKIFGSIFLASGGIPRWYGEVQLSDPLYLQVEGLAQILHVSIPELLRNAAEQMVQLCSAIPPCSRIHSIRLAPLPSSRRFGGTDFDCESPAAWVIWLALCARKSWQPSAQHFDEKKKPWQPIH